MPRYKFTIEYDGTEFVGWQRQENGVSVQSVLEEAIEKLCQEKVTVFGAGRTDSGVHAYGQVAHADFPREYPLDTIRSALNFHMKPAAVAVLEVEEVSEDFHARFSAKQRSYMYRIITRPAPLTLERTNAWHVPVLLDVKAMRKAAKYFVGKHDFTSFRASSCQANSALKTIDEAQVESDGDEIWFYVSARSFLHHMVRNMVGALKAVGEGKILPKEIKTLLQAKDRTLAPASAPAHGLYFMRVEY